ncbi:MAG: hypothetical protein R3A80_06710 [Bdellovibrionota bacterium]
MTRTIREHIKNGFSKGLSIILCLSFACPLKAQSYPKHLDKEFREDATLKVKRAVKIYNEARVEFEKKGGSAFAGKLNSLSNNTFTPSEEKFIAKKAAKEQILPTLEVRGDFLLGYEAKKVIFKLNTFDVAQGRFSFNDKTLIFNSNSRLIENYEKWSSTKTSSLNNSFFELFALKIKSLFLPEAHAFSKGTGALVGALLGGLLTYFLWPKVKEWFGGKPEVAATAHEAPLAPLNLAPAPAAPAATTAPAADSATTAPAAAASPPGTEITPEQSNAIAYIGPKYPDEKANSLQSLRDEQAKTDSKYPEHACKILEDLKKDIETAAGGLLADKNKARAIFDLLTHDKDSKEIEALDAFTSSGTPPVKCKETKDKIIALLK